MCPSPLFLRHCAHTAILNIGAGHVLHLILCLRQARIHQYGFPGLQMYVSYSYLIANDRFKNYIYNQSVKTHSNVS